MPSRLHARREMLKVLYPVTETGAKKKDTQKVDLVDKLFTEIAPKYKGRNVDIQESLKSVFVKVTEQWKLFLS